jgi:hypothetical protein
MTYPIAILIRHIDHDHDAIGRALFVPTMGSDDLGLIVDWIDMNALPSQPPRHS